MEKIITRFAPSPTGYLHIGSARTALFNYLYTKKYNGKFILRIEDTDRERSDPKFETDIVEGLSWLSMEWDSFYRQSDRTDIYREAVRSLIEKGEAYISKEEKPGGRAEVIRFKNPNKIIEFEDVVRGKISFDTTELGDFVIAKSETEPLYHFTVTVDDNDMGITDVIRAEDHISNTPRQILIIEALGCPRPRYAHIPLILATDRSKLSKRHGAVSVMDFKEKGYLPEAVVNYLALLGWNPGDDREIFPVDELIKAFSLDSVQKGGAVFDVEKLRWVNKNHLAKFVPDSEQYEEFKARATKPGGVCESRCWSFSDEYLKSIWSVFKERVSVYEDMDEILNSGEVDCFFEAPEYSPEGLLWKEQEAPEASAHLEEVSNKLLLVGEDEFNVDTLKDAIWDYATEKGRGNVLWPLRFSLSGKERSPDPFTLASVLGKKETLNRIEKAIDALKKIL